MRINYMSIVAGVIAFISLALPWWTLTMSAQVLEIEWMADISVYPYQASASRMGTQQDITMELEFGWAAFALIIIAGIAGIVGSVIVGKTGRSIISVAGTLMLLSIVVFAVGLYRELAEGAAASGFPAVGLFSSGSESLLGLSWSYTSYLSFGFWLALISAVLAFISLRKHPVAQ